MYTERKMWNIPIIHYNLVTKINKGEMTQTLHAHMNKINK
jgi:hypothetical protein